MELKGIVTVVTQPTTEPITLAQAKSHLRIDHSDDDTYLNLCITAARSYFEKMCEITIPSTTLKLSLDNFEDVLYLPKGPIQSVTEIVYYDSNEDEQNVADWQEDIASGPARLMPLLDESWPETAGIMNAVEVTYVAGFVNAAAVPELLKHGIKFYAGHLYENREAVTEGTLSEVPLAVSSIINLFTNGVYH
jgi:uncharacterized phiE125 gp8 family phage protein